VTLRRALAVVVSPALDDIADDIEPPTRNRRVAGRSARRAIGEWDLITKLGCGVGRRAAQGNSAVAFGSPT